LDGWALGGTTAHGAVVGLRDAHRLVDASARDNDRFLSYRELAPRLADYVGGLGFTHVEFMPVMEHPFYGSWATR